jgi:hypothetical protein
MQEYIGQVNPNCKRMKLLGAGQHSLLSSEYRGFFLRG